MRKSISFLTLLIMIDACSIFKTAENISRLKYRILSASDYKIAGIPLNEKKSIKDFTALETLKMTSSLMKGTLPVTFLLNIEAKNPNDGKGGYPRTDLTLQSFPWRLFINGNETISGNILLPVSVPGKGETTIIPLNIEFDVAKNIKEKNIDDIIALARRIGGEQNLFRI